MLKALKDLRIGLRIILGNFTLLLLMALVAVTGYAGLERVAEGNALALRRREDVADLRMLQLLLKNMYISQADFIYYSDPVAEQAFRNTVGHLRILREEIRQTIETEDERLNLNIIDRQTDEFINLFLEQIVPARREGNPVTLNKLNENSKELVSQIDPFIQNFIAEYEKKAEMAYQNAQNIKVQTILIVISLSFLAIVIGLVSGVILARTISSGAQQIVLASEQMRNAEEALRSSEMIFRHVVEAAPWGIHFYQLEADDKLVLLDANPSADAILGIEHKALVGKSIEEAFPGLAMTEVPQRYREVALKGVGWNIDRIDYDYENIHGVFEVRVFQISPGRVVAAFLDVAARIKIEQEREQFMRELARKNKELESIVYASSHDLRSPLLNIMGFSKLLQNACNELDVKVKTLDLSPAESKNYKQILEDRIPQALHFIIISATKMDVLISGLLRLSRLGRVALTIDNLDMNVLMRQVIDAMQFQIEKAGASIQVEELPGCRADASQINQVFTNLLDNALKYCDPARPLSILITGQIKLNQVIYCVEDNGIGIALEHQEKIWELFHRLDPAGTVPGEGLGLTLVLRILDRNNGSAWVESEPGLGSKFYIALPVSQISEEGKKEG
jgi:signal transduction histidine kinase